MAPSLVFNWLNESVIGIEVWQFIGLAALLIIIIALRFALVWLIWALLQRRTDPSRHRFWRDRQRRFHVRCC